MFSYCPKIKQSKFNIANAVFKLCLHGPEERPEHHNQQNSNAAYYKKSTRPIICSSQNEQNIINRNGEWNQWYTEAIRWAQANGIVKGYSAEKFDPEAPITREQMAAIFYRYAAFKGYDVSAGADLSKFSDFNKVDAWATENVAWANAVGLINGVSDTELDPLGLAKREQIAAILSRMMDTGARLTFTM